MEEADATVACEETQQVPEIDSGKEALGIIYSIYIILDNYFKNISSIYSTEGLIPTLKKAEQCISFTKSKLKVPKKRGRKPKIDPALQAEQLKHRKDLFVKFWTMYPRKEGETGTWRLWQRLYKIDEVFPKILAALEWQIPHWQGKYAPAPAKYILDQRWLDKPPAAQKAKEGSAFKDLGYEFPQN